MSECKFEFHPKQWVLVRDDDKEWVLCQFSHFSKVKSVYPYVVCGGRFYSKCIPYKGNEHLLGHTDDYVKQYEPKDGDFLVRYEHEVLICKNPMKDEDGGYKFYAYASYDKEDDVVNGCDGGYTMQQKIRPASEDEKQLLLSKLHEIGKDWDAEKKEVVAIVPPFVPKDGDFVKDVDDSIFVYKESKTAYFADCYVGYTEGDVDLVLDIEGYTDKNTLRPATEKDKEWFIQKMHDFGNDWDAEKKEVVDWKWEPEDGETYYYPGFNTILCKVESFDTTWTNDNTDLERKKRNFVFRTEEECQVMCDKLNEAIKNVK